MPARVGLPKRDMIAHLVLSRQATGRDEWVVACIQHLCGHLHTRQARLGAGAIPIIIGATKAV